MHIITRRRLRQFAETYASAKKPLDIWYHIVRRAAYQSTHDVKAHWGTTVDFLSNNRAVFDIGGNKYRLVVTIRYDWQKVFIRHVVAHSEYDRLSKAGLL